MEESRPGRLECCQVALMVPLSRCLAKVLLRWWWRGSREVLLLLLGHHGRLGWLVGAIHGRHLASLLLPKAPGFPSIQESLVELLRLTS